MNPSHALERDQKRLGDSIADLARNPDSQAIMERLRDQVGSAPGERLLLVQLLKTILAVYDPTDTVAPTVLTLVRTRLTSDGVTAALAGEPVIAPDPDELMTPDDVLRIARVRGQAQAQILSEPMYEADVVARVLGSSSTNPREYARQVRRRRGVIALRFGNRFVFPAFQFDPERHEVRPVVAEVNGLLGAEEDPWAVASFWFAPDHYLNARPADVVGDPDRAADVRMAADRELAPVG
jgi:hypothetical protein